MIERVVIDPPELADELARALPPELRGPKLGPAVAPADAAVHVFHTDLARWGDPSWDPGPLDWSIGDRAWIEPVWLRVRAPARPAAALAALLERALTRLQRFVERRNAASGAPWFERVLRRHRALHERRLPLVRVDHDHAVDTWRWVLRLAPDAGLPLQLGALFHDVERLESEARERREHRAADYDAFKQAHARTGALMTRRALVSAGVDAATVAEVEALVAEHERPGDDGASAAGERALLNDADALSFFSLNASGFLDYYGPAHTRKKIAYTLRRLRPEHHGRLCRLHLRADVLALLAEQLPQVRDHTTRRSA